MPEQADQATACISKGAQSPGMLLSVWWYFPKQEWVQKRKETKEILSGNFYFTCLWDKETIIASGLRGDYTTAGRHIRPWSFINFLHCILIHETQSWTKWLLSTLMCYCFMKPVFTPILIPHNAIPSRSRGLSGLVNHNRWPWPAWLQISMVPVGNIQLHKEGATEAKGRTLVSSNSEMRLLALLSCQSETGLLLETQDLWAVFHVFVLLVSKRLSFPQGKLLTHSSKDGRVEARPWRKK